MYCPWPVHFWSAQKEREKKEGGKKRGIIGQSIIAPIEKKKFAFLGGEICLGELTAATNGSVDAWKKVELPLLSKKKK